MKKHILAAIIAAASMASLQAQTTIVNYSTGATNVPGTTGYFNTADGWDGGTAAWAGDQGWTGNDALATSTEVVAGYTRTGSSANNNSGTLGFYAPTVASVDLNRAFTPMSPLQFTNIATSFTAEWALADLNLGPLGSDTFTFSLNDGGTSLLAFSMTTTGAGPGFDYKLSSDGSGAPVAQFDLNADSVYRMQIDIASNGTWTGTLSGVSGLDNLNPTITPLGAFTAGSLAAGAPSDIDNLNVNWLLASGNPATPGNLALFANELTIQSTGDPIPEPGTWAMAALLVSGAAATIYRRRKAAKEVPAA